MKTTVYSDPTVNNPPLRNRKIRLLLTPLLLVFLAVKVQGAVLSYYAILNGPSEFPANASPGAGTAEVDYNNTAHTLFIGLSFSGLTGTTTASPIHAPTASPFTGTAGVATTTPTFAGFPLGVTSGTYTNTLDLTQSSSWNPSFITANGGTTTGAETALAAAM